METNRKFKLTVGFTLILCYFFVFKLLTADQFIMLAKWALSGYLGANVVQKGVEALLTKPEAQA